MRILLLTHAFNSLAQRLYCELVALGHEVSIEFDIADSVTQEAVALFAPDLIRCALSQAAHSGRGVAEASLHRYPPGHRRRRGRRRSTGRSSAANPSGRDRDRGERRDGRGRRVGEHGISDARRDEKQRVPERGHRKRP
jgi:hypothetical protein